MKRVDSCAIYGWPPTLKASQVEGPARKEVRERIRHLPCRNIDVTFLVDSKRQFYWSTQSPYYGQIEIPESLFSWLDYFRPESMSPEDCVNVVMTYDDASEPDPHRLKFYVTVDFDEFMSKCGDLIAGRDQGLERQRHQIKIDGHWPNVV